MKFVNLTPHAIVIPETLHPDLGPWTLEPSGQIARATETVTEASPIGYIPTTRTQFGGVEGLPAPEWHNLPNPCDVPGAVPEGSSICLVCGALDILAGAAFRHVPGTPREPAVYYVVSSIAADAARRVGRSTEDLLTPGQQLRDASGRIIGCRSLVRV